MTVIETTYAPYPPTVTALGDEESGTITNISCKGPCICTIAEASGTVLMSINNPGPINMPVSLAFTGGAPVVSQSTPSSITLTM